MPWTDAPLTEITIPADATAPDPFIYVGTDDPNAVAEGIDAALALHFGDTGAYLIGVTQEDPPPPVAGHFNILATNSAPGSTNYRLMYSDYTGDIANCSLYFGEQTQGLTTTLAGADLRIQYNDTAAHDFTINGVSYPRGLVGRGARDTNSAAIGATETVMLTATMTGLNIFRAGRAYRAKFIGSQDVSVANSDSLFRVRKTNAAGQLLGICRTSGRLAATHYGAGFECVFTCDDSLFGVAVVLTLQGSAAHTSRIAAAAATPAIFTVEDIGAQSDWPDAPVLV